MADSSRKIQDRYCPSRIALAARALRSVNGHAKLAINTEDDLKLHVRVPLEEGRGPDIVMKSSASLPSRQPPE
jgi:hypothetical protein